MHWLLLIIAAIFEIGWPLGFKLSSTQPERFWTWIIFAIVSMALSGVFLYFAQRTIPVSTAYIIWTGNATTLNITCYEKKPELH